MDETYYAWVAYRYADLDELIVTDGDEVIASAPLPAGAVGPDSWDRLLIQLGYRRVSPQWQGQGDAGLRCRVRQLS